MGVTLFDQRSNEVVFDINFWHWRAIVEAVRVLDVLPDELVESLHTPFASELGEAECRIVAAAIRTRLLPTLADDERVLLDGRRTTAPDDGTFHRDPAEQHRNYSTNRAVLAEFAACCATCSGFRVA